MTRKRTRTGSRKFEDWVDAFIKATANTSVPELFRRWAAIGCIAGTLERRTWVFTKGSKLYPNLYTILVARPGIGKTEILDRVRLLWEGLDGAHVGSANLTRASLADELKDAKVLIPGDEYNSLLICINELGTFMSSYELDFVSSLTDLYDCKVYSERKRSKDLSIRIESPQVNLLCGGQPGLLQAMLPEIAWDQGFTSRCIMIYSGEEIREDLFDVAAVDLGDVLTDLYDIRNAHGEIGFTQEAKILINTWHKGGGDPRPMHPKLSHYCTRRTAHLLKLSQIASLSENNKLLIEERHVQRALRWLLEAEGEMDSIFKVMTSGGDSSIISDAYHFLEMAYLRGKQQPVQRTRLVAFLSEKTDAYKVRHILDVMQDSGMVKVELAHGKTAYVPQRRPQ